jgi:ABC-type proline/glycine betaine transport system permease subunit
LITDGMRRDYTAKLVLGTLLSTGLAVIVNQFFQWLEELALRNARGGFIFRRQRAGAP